MEDEPVYSTCSTPERTPDEVETHSAAYWKAKYEETEAKACEYKKYMRKWQKRAQTNYRAMKALARTI